jgi:hypothetical protein
MLKKIIILLLFSLLFGCKEKIEAVTISNQQKNEPFIISGYDFFEGTDFSKDGPEGFTEPGYIEDDSMTGEYIEP